MRFELNLASRPFVNYLPHAILLGSLTLGAAGLTTWNATRYFSSRSEAKAVEAQLAAIDAEEADLEERRDALATRLREIDFVELWEQVDAANTVLSEKAVLWSVLLERLEDLAPWSTALDSIRTSVSGDDVRLNLTLRAKNQDYYLDLIDALEGSPCFAAVYPGNETRLQTNEFSLTLQAEYDPRCGDGPPEQAEARRRSRRGGRTRG